MQEYPIIKLISCLSLFVCERERIPAVVLRRKESPLWFCVGITSRKESKIHVVVSGDVHDWYTKLPRPSPSFPLLAVRKSGRGPGTLYEWGHTQGKLCKRGHHKKLHPHPCSRATILSREMAAHKGDFMSLFTRQSREHKQNNEDAQQHFSRARPRSIKVFLPSFYLWHHSREEIYQVLPALLLSWTTSKTSTSVD